MTSALDTIGNIWGDRAQPKPGLFDRFRDDAVGYSQQVLHNTPWSVQQAILRQCTEPGSETWDGKLAIGAGVSTGKTHVLGSIVNWFHDIGPGIAATTAPNYTSVVDLLWKEVRVQRGRGSDWGIGANDFIGPAAPELRKRGLADWWARGYVAAQGENFKGRHTERMLFIFDEAVGLKEMYFRATKTMFKPCERGERPKHLWLMGYNPTDTSSAMYQEIMSPESTWTVMELSTLDHPNVLAGLAGLAPVIPAAVSLGQMEQAIREDCQPVEGEIEATDFEWPPGSGYWWRPGPFFEANFLGRWPREEATAIWYDSLWKGCTVAVAQGSPIPAMLSEYPQIGADLAFRGDRFGLHCRWGAWSIRHGEHQGMRPTAAQGLIIERAEEAAGWYNQAIILDGGNRSACSATDIPIVIDDDGAGRVIGDFLMEQGFTVYLVNAGSNASMPTRYPNRRSELWFQTAEKAKRGLVRLGRLPMAQVAELRRQSRAPLWALNGAGQRVVEEKKMTVARLGRSPDGMDAVNLAYLSHHSLPPQWVTPALEVPKMYGATPNPRVRNKRFRGIFGVR